MVNALYLSSVNSSSCFQDHNSCGRGERRSKRKKSSYQGPTFSEDAARKITKFKTYSNAACLTSLPYLALSRLLQFLDVQSLENLSATCSMFDQLIAGQYLTSISIPFSSEFVSEIKAAKFIDKKPLLKLEFGRSNCKSLLTMLRGGDGSGYVPDYIPLNIVWYLMESQLSLLNLGQLREIDFVVNSSTKLNFTDMCNIIDFYRSMFMFPNNRFQYEHITRLHLMTDEHTETVLHIVSAMKNLIELGLHIHVRKNLDNWSVRNYYINELQNILTASCAPILKLTILSETRMSVEKKLISSVVERLEIEGPCTVNIVPVMRNLKEVVVKPKSTDELCTYWRIKREDRAIHRAGLCCVNIGSTYLNCPNLTRFMGIDMPSIPHDRKSGIWNLKLRKKFYKLYTAAGGSMEFKVWCKMRWFSKKLKQS